MPQNGFDIIRAMRTTIDIPDVLYRSMKARCAAMGTTMRHVTIALDGDWMQGPEQLPRVKTEYVLADAPKPQKTDAKSLIPFLGIARKGANLNVSHDMASIRRSIAKGLKKEYAELKKRRGFV